MATRARSADAGGQQAHPVPQDFTAIDRLAAALEQANLQPRGPAPTPFKPPQFDGSGEVELFISQFVDVADANQWLPAHTLLHLRESLKGETRDCGKAGTVAGIFNALRSRYGLSIREARSQLTALKRGFRTSLHTHAAEVEKLVSLAYADLPLRHQQEMALEKFQNSLGNAYLQRHLLAMHPQTLEDAVRASSEFLQISSPSSNVHQVQSPEEAEVSPPQVAPVQDPLAALSKHVQDLATQVAQLTQLQLRQSSAQASKPSPPNQAQRGKPDSKGKRVCYGCFLEGHIRADCPTHPWDSPSANTAQGNDHGPQQ